MLSAETFDLVEQIVRYFINRTKPFGWIQIVVCGDFFQLPPVVKYWIQTDKLFARQSDARPKMDFSVCYLSEQYRQSDTKFLDILNQIRNNAVNEESLEILRKRFDAKLDGVVEPTKLYTHNIDVDRINYEALARIEEEEHTFYMLTKGKKAAIEILEKSILAVDELKLKLGAAVIFIKNSTDWSYMNGTLGKVIWFDEEDGFPLVKIRSWETIKANLETWMLEDDEKMSAKIFQVPLKLARAITVHKSQWMSLDAAEIDLSKVFEYGQSYVALSRVKSLSGLRLVGLNEDALTVHPEVLEADMEFRTISDSCKKHFWELEKKEKTEIHKTFVELMEGEFFGSDLEEISWKKSKKSWIKQTSTYHKTLELIDQKKTLWEIADIRGVSSDTIVKHFYMLREIRPDLNLYPYKPDSEVVSLVRKAVAKMGKSSIEYEHNGAIKLKPIFEELNEEFSYADIRLSLLFV